MQRIYYSKKNASEDHVQKLVLHPEHINDSMLWKAFKSGNEKALIIIFERFSKPLYSYGSKITGDTELVEDCIQDLFIEIWQSRSTLGDTDSIKFYLFKSLRRKLMRMKKKRDNRTFKGLTLDQYNESSPSHEFVIISEQVSSEQRERLMRMLDNLTPRQHEAIFLRYLEELKCEQIAEVMKLRKQVVYNLIHDSLNQLRKITQQNSSPENKSAGVPKQPHQKTFQPFQ